MHHLPRRANVGGHEMIQNKDINDWERNTKVLRDTMQGTGMDGWGRKQCFRYFEVDYVWRGGDSEEQLRARLPIRLVKRF